MKTYQISSDQAGVMASGLCILHCFATPIIFILGTCNEACHQDIPFWWSGFEFIFVAISFFAIYHSTRLTSSQFIKPLFWSTWALICLIVFNERFYWTELPEYLIYIPSTLLIGFHIYNLKFCMCVKETQSCCTTDHPSK